MPGDPPAFALHAGEHDRLQGVEKPANGPVVPHAGTRAVGLRADLHRK